jgi:hypothetical protein
LLTLGALAVVLLSFSITLFMLQNVSDKSPTQSVPSNYMAQGWALSPKFRPIEIQIVDNDGQPVRSRFEVEARPDLKPIFESGQLGPPSLGFKVYWPMDEKGLGSARFKILMEDNKSALSEPISSIPLHEVIKLSTTDGGSPVFFAVDNLIKP